LNEKAQKLVVYKAEQEKALVDKEALQAECRNRKKMPYQKTAIAWIENKNEATIAEKIIYFCQKKEKKSMN